MDENALRSLLARLADSAGPPRSVSIEKARRVGLRRRLLRQLGVPTASVGVVLAAGLVAGGVVPLGAGPGSISATVKLTRAEIAVLTNTGSVPSTNAQIDNAYQVLIHRCMAAKGFRYHPLFRSVADEGGQPGLHHFPGLAGIPQAPIGLAAREANGYGFYAEALRGRQHRGGGHGHSRKPDPPGWLKALWGTNSDRVSITGPLLGTGSVPGGGCYGAVERRLYGSVYNYVLATEGSSLMPDALLSAVTADPRFTAVVSRWASCMAGRGFAYQSPEELWNSLGGKIDTATKLTPALRQLEIRTALADYRCAGAVHLLATVRALQARHAMYFSETLERLLDRLIRIDARALRIAQTLHPHLPGTR